MEQVLASSCGCIPHGARVDVASRGWLGRSRLRQAHGRAWAGPRRPVQASLGGRGGSSAAPSLRAFRPGSAKSNAATLQWSFPAPGVPAASLRDFSVAEQHGGKERRGKGGDLEEEADGGGEAGELGSSISDFTRFYEEPERGVVELQTAIVTYWKQGPWWDILRPEVQVDLVSVVHIGDPEYYQGLQDELYTYDRVLYEMVTEKKQRPLRAERRGVWSAWQQAKGGQAREGSGPAAGHSRSGEADTKATGSARRVGHGTSRRHAEEGEEGEDVDEGSESDEEDVAAVKRRRFPGAFAGSTWKRPLRGFRRRGKRRGASIVGFIQRNMARALQLSFQLDHIDYQAPNFLNADLDFGTFSRLQKERKESIFSLAKEVSVKSTKVVMATMEGIFHDPALNQMNPVKKLLFWASRSVPMPLVGLLLIDTMCRPPGSPSGIAAQPAVKALLNLDVASAMKVFLAQQMSSDALDTAASVMEQSVIVGERNKAAMEELHRALDDGCRRIAIFYGSAHLPDLHRRLKSELGLQPVGLQWRTAWSIIGKQNTWMQGNASAELATLGEGGVRSLPPPRREASRSRLLRKNPKNGGVWAARWPLSRYQTIALMILSLVLAIDLWLWELLFEGIEQSGVQLIVFVANILDKGWSL